MSGVNVTKLSYSSLMLEQSKLKGMSSVSIHSLVSSLGMWQGAYSREDHMIGTPLRQVLALLTNVRLE
jgi:hypothetical protein